VRVGNSGLEFSKIILACMSYGTLVWQDWVLELSSTLDLCNYDHGTTTFDTADAYSNGLSETIPGKAIKQLNLPREQLVIMTNSHLGTGLAAR
ncbi:NADP-dependent oxidoreductase domain-containing protein, partial [Trametes elegans]